MGAEGEVRFDTSDSGENFISFRLSVLDGLDIIGSRPLGCIAILGRALGEVVVLRRQIRPAQLIGKF